MALPANPLSTSIVAGVLGLSVGPLLARLAQGRPTPGTGDEGRARMTCQVVSTLLCAMAFSTLGVRFGATLECVEAIALAASFVVMALADLDRRVIPNGAILPACLTRIAYLLVDAASSGQPFPAGLGPSLLSGLAIGTPALLLALAMDRILGRQSLGGGDVKLFFVVGLCLGIWEGLLAVLLACVLGVGSVALRSLRERARGRTGRSSEPFAFGPCIVAACWVMALWGARLPACYA